VCPISSPTVSMSSSCVLPWAVGADVSGEGPKLGDTRSHTLEKMITGKYQQRMGMMFPFVAVALP
jgi:hypothetical protein